MTADDVCDTLRELMRATATAGREFEHAAGLAKARELVDLFRERARSCAVALDDLRFALRGVGGEQADESVGRWQIEAGRENESRPVDDREVLAWAERAENGALAAYLAALARPLPEDVKKIVRSQLDGVQHDRDRLRALIDAADGSPTQARVARL